MMFFPHVLRACIDRSGAVPTYKNKVCLSQAQNITKHEKNLTAPAQPESSTECNKLNKTCPAAAW